MSRVKILEHQLEMSHSVEDQLTAERDNCLQKLNENEGTISKLKIRVKDLTQDVYMLKNLVVR